MMVTMSSHFSFLKHKVQMINDNFLTRKLLEDIPKLDIERSDKIFLFSHRGSQFYKKLYLLTAHALSKKGYPCSFLFRDGIIRNYSPKISRMIFNSGRNESFILRKYISESYLPKLIVDNAKISFSLYNRQSKYVIYNDCKNTELNFKWKINYEKEKIEVSNVNFFPVIRNTLQSLYKRYEIDFRDKNVISTCSEMIKSCDLLFHYFLILKKYSKEQNKKIKIVGWETSYIPNGVFRLLCDSLSENNDIEYIDLARGYMHYFGYHSRESYISLANLTRSKVQNRLIITKDELERIRNSDIDENELIKPLNKSLKKFETSKFNINQKKVIDLIEKYNSNNLSVFVLFSHLFYDTPWDDSSLSFENMLDWIKSTVESFKNKDNLLILKPHPSESRPDEPQKEPSQTLESFIESDIEEYDNILLLNPRLFNVKQLYPYITCGLVWRSSVGMELTYLGIPCIIAGTPPYHKTLDLLYPENKLNYFGLIDRAKSLKISKEQKVNVARYLYYLEHFKHHYIDLIEYDKKSKYNKWNKKNLQNYLINENKKIDAVIAELLK